jgi:hypothetical protein
MLAIDRQSPSIEPIRRIASLAARDASTQTLTRSANVPRPEIKPGLWRPRQQLYTPTIPARHNRGLAESVIKPKEPPLGTRSLNMGPTDFPPRERQPDKQVRNRGRALLKTRREKAHPLTPCTTLPTHSVPTRAFRQTHFRNGACTTTPNSGSECQYQNLKWHEAHHLTYP